MARHFSPKEAARMRAQARAVKQRMADDRLRETARHNRAMTEARRAHNRVRRRQEKQDLAQAKARKVTPKLCAGAGWIIEEKLYRTLSKVQRGTLAAYRHYGALGRYGAWPKLATVAADIGTTQKHVSAALKRLIALGILIRLPRHREHGRSAAYRFATWSEWQQTARGAP